MIVVHETTEQFYIYDDTIKNTYNFYINILNTWNIYNTHMRYIVSSSWNTLHRTIQRTLYTSLVEQTVTYGCFIQDTFTDDTNSMILQLKSLCNNILHHTDETIISASHIYTVIYNFVTSLVDFCIEKYSISLRIVQSLTDITNIFNNNSSNIVIPDEIDTILIE